jgi:hypothetical protein
MGFTATFPSLLDERVALVLFILLLVAAATPIVIGWLRLLPSEGEPFATPGETQTERARDGFAIFLLANITLGLLVRIPGVEALRLSSHIIKLLPPDWADNTHMVVSIWFGSVPGLAAAYSAVRANPIRLPLLVGGVLTLILWFAGPWLLASIVGTT